ncbi:hypothetical protein [Mesorhizobium sp. dw_380]|uniref:hypothetical protein n=1 Tax=Mesorhizobium sp. dw_380 TaxID=2812001 RepID=UPI001BDDD2D2|nr:hypothetical protein [Mesorhizobium sp. dw_380]
MAWKITDISIGDEVAITVTVLRMLDGARASVSIPSYAFPHSMSAPKRTEPGDELELRGKVSRIDAESQKVTLKAGGLITVDADVITDWTPVARTTTALRHEAR